MKRGAKYRRGSEDVADLAQRLGVQSGGCHRPEQQRFRQAAIRVHDFVPIAGKMDPCDLAFSTFAPDPR